MSWAQGTPEKLALEPTSAMLKSFRVQDFLRRIERSSIPRRLAEDLTRRIYTIILMQETCVYKFPDRVSRPLVATFRPRPIIFAHIFVCSSIRDVTVCIIVSIVSDNVMMLMPLCYVVVRLERLPSHSAILFSRSFFSCVYVTYTSSCSIGV